MNDSKKRRFFTLGVPKRRQLVAEQAHVAPAMIEAAFEKGGLDVEKAEKLVENVIGTYALPFGLALNVVVNGVERLAPMVTEEPSVIAAASNAAKMVRASGGFEATLVEELMIAQIQLFDVPDFSDAARRILAEQDALLQLGASAVPDLLRVGGGPRHLAVRDLSNGMLVVHVHVDCVDAMGANIVNTIAEAMGRRLAELARGKLGLRILSNLADRRVVHARCRVQESDLAASRRGAVTAPSGISLMLAIEQASRFAEADPYRAATHNKGILNGIDAVAIATGNDWRAVEAGAHAFAARTDRYRPLAIWRCQGGELKGELEMPLALGTIGGTLRAHPVARLALSLARIERARDLIELAACVGLASNLAALRALASEGIQPGHMSLHARAVAVIAGAEGSEVERVAAAIIHAKQVHVDLAREELRRVRESVV
jgi:hydroxymethylglutaryl-CoA reductase